MEMLVFFLLNKKEKRQKKDVIFVYYFPLVPYSLLPANNLKQYGPLHLKLAITIIHTIIYMGV